MDIFGSLMTGFAGSAALKAMCASWWPTSYPCGPSVHRHTHHKAPDNLAHVNGAVWASLRGLERRRNGCDGPARAESWFS
jgi:hypothetical protein